MHIRQGLEAHFIHKNSLKQQFNPKTNPQANF